MAWEVEYTTEFESWWNDLEEAEQEDIAAYVVLLQKKGPNLDHPYSSKINASKFSHMRELRVQHKGKPYRIFYAFDPRRHAVLLLGGNKTGSNLFYKKMVPLADKIYEQHLCELKEELKNHGKKL